MAYGPHGKRSLYLDREDLAGGRSHESAARAALGGCVAALKLLPVARDFVVGQVAWLTTPWHGPELGART